MLGRIAKGDEQVEMAVVVEIDPGDLAGDADHVEADFGGDIDEMPAIDHRTIQFIAVRAAGEADVEIEWPSES